MARLIVADASAQIAYRDPTDRHHEGAIETLIAVEGFIVRPLTLAEVLLHPARQGREAVVVNVPTSVGLRESPVPVDPISLARLRAKAGLKLPDCVVLSTAIWHHLSVFTFSERLAAASADIAAD